MSADNQTTTLSWHIDGHLTNMLVDMSTDKRPIYWSICLPTYRSHGGLYINWDIGCVTVDISTNISVDMLINISTEGCKDPRKLGHFLKMFLKVVVDQKGHVGKIQYFGWLLLSLEIAFDHFFNAVKINQILLSDWLSELARWTYLKHSGFSVFVPQEKVLFLVRT